MFGHVCVSVCITWTAQPSISSRSLFRSSMLLAGDNKTQRGTVHQNISESSNIVFEKNIKRSIDLTAKAIFFSTLQTHR